MFKYDEVTVETAADKLRQILLDLKDPEQNIDAAIEAISSICCKETNAHMQRVAEYSRLLAKLYGASEIEAEMVKKASPLHDIGKIGIPEEILTKADNLTPIEREIMNSHAILGYEMLKNSPMKVLQTASLIALDHHECWDGSGYPQGKKQEEIHLYGRITSLSDVFDALSSNRYYKEAWKDDAICDYIKEHRASRFDPTLVDLFLENYDQFVAIRNKIN
ncbi:MAG: HD domain-containing protein [Gammaproteobacteria bacterium]|nr:HD domain-containing protein [Gammaproteobacteria bacterium]MDH5628728.1 HD domain-containing protein [Gammaproteobacteria bacterium]